MRAPVHKSHYLLLLLLCAATLAVYWPVSQHRFLLNWDDLYYVVDNPAVRGFSLPHLKEAFTRFYVANYAPLQIVSYMADYTIWGLRPGGFLLDNVLIHCLNGALFYWLLLRLTGKRSVAAGAAFIFLLHPVQVESVAWVSQRKNLLCMTFFLASFHGYLTFRDEAGPRRRWAYLLSLASFALSLLVKPVSVIMPAALLLFDLCYLEKSRRGGWLANKIPYAVVAAAVAALALFTQSSVIEQGSELYRTSSRLGMCYTMLTVLGRYFGLLFFPTRLSVLYMPPLKFSVDAAVAGCAFLALLLAALGVFLFRRNRQLFFWYALFFLGLLPVSQIVPLVTLMNDRYLYFPLLGLAPFLACSLQTLLSSRPRQQIIVAAALALLLAPLPFLSAARVRVWRDDVSLWADVTRKTPEATQAWLGLGMSLYDAGDRVEALAAYRKALAIDPNYLPALNNIGLLYGEMGRRDLGGEYLERARLLGGSFGQSP